MQKPTLAQFGLTKEDVRREENRLRNPLPVRALLGACVIGGAVVGLGSNGAGGALLGGILGLPAFALTASIWMIVFSIRRSADPLSRKVDGFLKAQVDYEEWHKRTQTMFWQSLSGRQFEHEFAKVLVRLGYEVRLVGGRDDGGVDLVASRRSREIVVQCKAWPSRKVGPAVLRELYGALIHSGASSAILATTGELSDRAHEFRRGKPIQVWTIGDLIRASRDDVAPLLG